MKLQQNKREPPNEFEEEYNESSNRESKDDAIAELHDAPPSQIRVDA